MQITGPLFKWFGSKWLASKLYPAPLYDQIVERFAGCAGYSLRHAERQVSIWEDNPDLRALWTWLIGPATGEEIFSIPCGISVGADIRQLGLSEGQALLLRHWQRTNNVGTCWTISPWGNLPGQWTERTRERVAREVELVKHWRLSRRAPARATHFVDPPYFYNYRYGFKSFDYAALGRELAELRHPRQLIVCEAACPKTGAVPTWLPFTPFARRVTSRRASGNHHHSSELIYYEER